MRNVVVLCLDSVRKDFFETYAPRLRRRADVSLDGCRAASSWSTPSYASMLTGELPHSHGVHTHDMDYSSLASADTLFDRLPDHESIGVSSNVFAGPAYNFDAPFDEFSDVSEARRFPGGLDPAEFLTTEEGDVVGKQISLLKEAATHRAPARSLANAALSYGDSVSRRLPTPRLFDGGTKPILTECTRLAERREEPFVLLAVMMEAHLPLEPTVGYDDSLHSAPKTFSTTDRGEWELLRSQDPFEEYLRHWRGLYGASIDYLDRLLVDFVDEIQDRTARETTVVVTADHGENLGYPAEDGLVRHRGSLSEGLLHVPCSIFNPPAEAPEFAGRYASHLDFVELVPALARGELPDVTRDAVPAELVGMSAGPEPPADGEFWDRMIRAVYDGDGKYVADSLGECRRYPLDPDRPCWQGDPVDLEDLPACWAEFFADDLFEYKRRAAAGETHVEVTADTQQRLEELGYL